MDQGVISALKRSYRSALLKKRIEEGGDLKAFWKDYTILDGIYEISAAWENIKSLTIVRSWQKIIPDISEDSEFSGFSEEEITATMIRKIPGGEDVDEQNLQEWFECDANERGYEQMTDEQTVSNVKGVDVAGGEESESEEEGETAASSQQTQTLSHGAALAQAETLLEYVESQDDSLITDTILLRNLISRIKRRCFSAQKQKTIKDFFSQH